jgi:thiol-disulfide isomerase/thioredoxin
MKKRIPLFTAIFLFGFYLIGQGYLMSTAPNASPVGAKQSLFKSYESALKKSTFKDINGKTYSFKNTMPKVVIVNFWASWCTPCLEEFPSITKLQEKYGKNKNFLFLGINTDDENVMKKIKKTVSRYKLNIPIVTDTKGKHVENYSISAIPVSIVYKDGKVVEVSNGAKDFYSEEFLSQLKDWKL